MELKLYKDSDLGFQFSYGPNEIDKGLRIIGQDLNAHES